MTDDHLLASDNSVVVKGIARDIVVGYPIEKHERMLQQQLSQLEKRINSEHEKTLRIVELEKAAVERDLNNLNASYQEILDQLQHALNQLEEIENDGAHRSNVQNDLLQRAKVALTKGELDLADQVLQMIENQSSETVERAGHAAFERGNIALARNQWIRASDHYLRAARLCFENSHFVNKAGEIAWLVLRNDEALSMRKREVELAVSAGQENTLNHAVALNNLATVLQALSRRDEAAEEFNKSLATYKQHCDPDDLMLAFPMNNLGRLLIELDEHDKAKSHLIEAVRIGELNEESARHELCVWYSGLGWCHTYLEEHQDALNCVNLALSTAEKYLESGDFNRSTWLMQRAETYNQLARPSEAREDLREALEMRTKLFGKDHQLTKEAVELVEGRWPKRAKSRGQRESWTDFFKSKRR